MIDLSGRSAGRNVGPYLDAVTDHFIQIIQIRDLFLWRLPFKHAGSSSDSLETSTAQHWFAQPRRQLHSAYPQVPQQVSKVGRCRLHRHHSRTCLESIRRIGHLSKLKTHTKGQKLCSVVNHPILWWSLMYSRYHEVSKFDPDHIHTYYS